MRLPRNVRPHHARTLGLDAGVTPRLRGTKLTARASASSFGRPVGPLDDAARMRLLYELGNAFAARLELRELLPLVVDKCRDVIEAEGAAVLLLDHDADELYFPYAASDDPD